MKLPLAIGVLVVAAVGGYFLVTRYPRQAAAPVAGTDVAIVTEDSFEWQDASGTCTIALRYPRVSGIPDAASQRINDGMRERMADLMEAFQARDDEGRPMPPQELSRPDLPLDCGYYEEIPSYQVTYNGSGFISIRYDGVGGVGAHPWKNFNAAVFSLKDGEWLNYDLFFKGDPANNARINELISSSTMRALAAYDAEVSPLGPQERFDFYLTPAGATFFNLYDAYALGSVEAPVSRADLAGLTLADWK